MSWVSSAGYSIHILNSPPFFELMIYVPKCNQEYCITETE